MGRKDIKLIVISLENSLSLLFGTRNRYISGPLARVTHTEIIIAIIMAINTVVVL